MQERGYRTVRIEGGYYNEMPRITNACLNYIIVPGSKMLKEYLLVVYRNNFYKLY